MKLFTRKKKLTLRQVHELYLLLKHALPEKEEKFLIDQVEYILGHSKSGTLMKSLAIMYPKIPKDIDAIQAATMFVAGLRECSFFDYTEFLRGLRNAR